MGVPYLLPSLNMVQIFGRELLYTPRPSSKACKWLPSGGNEVLDGMTAGLIPVLGGMPILCSAGVSTPEGLQLLRDTGYQLPELIIRYHNLEDYLTNLKKLYCQGWTLFYI